jgi:hypothetical protein
MAIDSPREIAVKEAVGLSDLSNSEKRDWRESFNKATQLGNNVEGDRLLGVVIPLIKIRNTISQFRVPRGIEFTDVIKEKLQFLIPITDPDIVKTYPNIFQLARAEYSDSLNVWLSHQLISNNSEMSVMNLDAMWQNIIKRVGLVNIFLDEHDESSKARMRPDFTAMFHKILVMKGEAKAKLSDMIDSSEISSYCS